MQWEGNAFCLNSKSVVGEVVTLQRLKVGDLQSPHVLVANSLSPSQIITFLDKNLIKGVVLRSGSLTDHTAVLLNARGIQLAIQADLPLLRVGTPLMIDGTNERVRIGNDAVTLKAGLPSEEETQHTTYPATPKYRGEEVLVCSTAVQHRN